MIKVPVQIRKSPIHGKGVFATRKIKKGTVVVKAGTKERHYSPKQYRSVTPRYRKILSKFGYWENGVLVYPLDEAKYLNHSCHPNIVNKGDVDIAARAISAGEELTYDYQWIPSKKKFMCNCHSLHCLRNIIS